MSADKVIFFPKVLQILEFDSNRTVRDDDDDADDNVVSMSAYITSRYYKPYLSGSPRDRPSKERQLGKKNCLKQTIARPSCPPYQASCF